MSKNNNILLVGGASCVTETITVTASSFFTTSIPYNLVKNIWGDVPNTGGEIVPTGTIDPTNVSTGEANLINNNYTDLCYNNSSTGSANKELPAIDLGTSIAVNQIHVHWWNNTYTAADYRIEGSNDGTTWTPVITGLDSTGIVGTASNPQIITVSSTFQYWRVFCVTGNNASWCVVSEMEAFAPAGGSSLLNLLESTDVVIGSDGTNLTIDNTLAIDIDVEINYMR